MSEALRWAPVANDQAGWMEATQQLRTAVNANLPPPPYEPYGTQPNHTTTTPLALCLVLLWGPSGKSFTAPAWYRSHVSAHTGVAV